MAARCSVVKARKLSATGQTFYALDRFVCRPIIRQLVMCLLYIIGGLGILLTIISGQYDQHTILFWSFLSATVATGFFYSLQRRIMADPRGQGRNTFLTVELGTGICGFITIGLFVWLCIVVWI